MIEVTQTRTGAPHGNCHQACLASIFEVPLGSVPDPVWPDGVPWSGDSEQTKAAGAERNRAFDEWARSLGFETVCLNPWSGAPDVYHLIAVTNPRGVPHYIVGRGGRAVWDPNPLRDSLDAVHEFYVFFVAVDPAALARRPGAEAS
ncbi:MAG: hypothetical protein AB7O67_16625 [Vicinamibacterales bacterium]